MRTLWREYGWAIIATAMSAVMVYFSIPKLEWFTLPILVVMSGLTFVIAKDHWENSN